MKPDPGRGHAEGQVRRGQPSPRTQAPGLPVTLGTGVAGRLHGHRHDQAAGQTPQAPSPAGALSRAHTPPSFAESLGRWGLQQGTGPALTHTAPPAELAWVSGAHRRKGEGSGLFLGATHPGCHPPQAQQCNRFPALPPGCWLCFQLAEPARPCPRPRAPQGLCLVAPLSLARPISSQAPFPPHQGHGPHGQPVSGSWRRPGLAPASLGVPLRSPFRVALSPLYLVTHLRPRGHLAAGIPLPTGFSTVHAQDPSPPSG